MKEDKAKEEEKERKHEEMIWWMYVHNETW